MTQPLSPQPSDSTKPQRIGDFAGTDEEPTQVSNPPTVTEGLPKPVSTFPEVPDHESRATLLDAAALWESTDSTVIFPEDTVPLLDTTASLTQPSSSSARDLEYNLDYRFRVPGQKCPASASQPFRYGRKWLLPGIVLLAVVAYFAWSRYTNLTDIASVTVRASPAKVTCDETIKVIGLVKTNGDPGIISYRWLRSDGTHSATLREYIAWGTRQTEVSMHWAVEGRGSFRATATLELLPPTPMSARITIPYSC
ncbi:hypothetical protein [Streptomyces sp. NBC_00289]|uniref:hypothetical protein n=1 Tax=Streptomyces sp. NBC_00289 TaxID=2975703 RepID=UPI00352F1138